MLPLGVVDYGGGNIQSVRNALSASGAEFVEIASPERLDHVGALIFPGQGAFGDSMNALQQRRLVEPLRNWLNSEKPFFGICIGYQLLFESSEENPGVEGLGIYKGRVVKFTEEPGLKIPHMGWNNATVSHPENPAWTGLGNEPFFYFVHSYFPAPEDESIIATRTAYGASSFASSIQQGEILATQFHPEKSQENGLRLLGNFINRHR